MNKRDRIKELKQLILDTENEIKKATITSNNHNAMQLGLKLILNGSYGCFLNKHFAAFCNGIGSSITAHGRDLIRHMGDVNEDYWYNYFHLDLELHKQVAIFAKVLKTIERNGLNKYDIINNQEAYDEFVSTLDLSDIKTYNIEKLFDGYVDSYTEEPILNPTMDQIFKTGEAVRKVPTAIYIDTDSLFVGFKPCIKAYEWEHDELDLILFVSKVRLQPYFREKLQGYADKYKVKNLEDFELEQISKSIIFLEKKMYVKNIIWEEGIYKEPETYIEPKGIDLVRSSSPAFVRDKENGVYKIIKYFFKNPETYNDRDLVKLVRDMKKLFMLAPIEDISMGTSCSNYNSKVIDDTTTLKLVKAAHHGVKASAFHNYLLNNNPSLKQKYNLIKGGQKVKYYYTTHNLCNEFAYNSGAYPVELGNKYAPVDYDTQFEKCVLTVVNRFAEKLKLSKLTPRLTFTLSLF